MGGVVWWTCLSPLFDAYLRYSCLPRIYMSRVLYQGPTGTGKTAIAAKLCFESQFPFVRMISADSMIGYSESQKCQTLLKVRLNSHFLAVQ